MSGRLDACEKYDRLKGDRLKMKRQLFKEQMQLKDMLAELGTLRVHLDRDYQNAINDIFRPVDAAPGAAHHALAKLGVKAILTTNYDSLIEEIRETPTRRAYTWKEADKALNDLKSDRRILLKVHGTAEHHDTVVIGEREYYEAHSNHSYQAVLKYLLNDHVFLFVGYGMHDPYDLDLALEQNVNDFKIATPRHYVLMARPPGSDGGRFQRESEQFSDKYNVEVVPYEDHAQLPNILEALAAIF